MNQSSQKTEQKGVARYGCEICGDVVVKSELAQKCGHRVNLCETCKQECPGALRLCVECEDKS